MRVLAALLSAAAVAVSASAAFAQVFSSATPITIPDAGAATPYPSVITVSGVAGPVEYIRVTLNGLNHTFLADLDIVLVAPGGQVVVLFSDAGGLNTATGAAISFTPDGQANLRLVGGVLQAGAYVPQSADPGDVLPAPAPSTTPLPSLENLYPFNPNGTWSLYVVDDEAPDAGSIAGWSIEFNGRREAVAPSTAFTYQGILEGPGGPVNGPADLRFTLWDNPVSPNPANRLAAPITLAAVPVVGGRFTVSLDFGTAVNGNQGQFLAIEARETGGGSFVALTPRQPLTLAPKAGRANVAALAEALGPAAEIALRDRPLRLRQPTDDNHVLRYAGPGASFALFQPDGPLLHGASGGILGTAIGGDERIALVWNSERNVGIGGLTNPTLPLEVAGRVRFRDGVGGSAGHWLASGAPAVDRAFVGLLDDDNAGFFVNGGWRLRVHSSGNVAIGDGGATATPPAQLTVAGGIQVGNRFSFGNIGNFAGTAQNSDPVYFQRVDVAADVSTLRLLLGDNPGAVAADSLSIGAFNIVAGDPVYNERFNFRSDGTAFKLGGGSWAALSDPAAKHDARPLTGALEKLLTLRGYTFLYNDDVVAAGRGLPGEQIGLMADEVERVFPDWVTRDASGTRYVSERATTALLVEALRDLRQEKDRQLDAAQADVRALQRENERLKTRLEAIEARLDAASR